MNKRLTYRRIFGWLLLLLTAGMSRGVFAATNLATSPLFLTQGSTPLVMLNMSRDHQLYFKAYDDYSDIDGDGAPDTTYKNSIKYYGYFDNSKCYVYASPAQYFIPSSNMTADNYCNGTSTNSDGTTTDYSNAKQWSGNFLNWASMTRIDAVRKILYGGLRSTDTATATILERSFLPNDAHSFAKYYDGSDVAKLTPFTSVTSGTGTTQTEGITICNTTYEKTNALLSQNVTAAPLMRIAKGNYALWASNERWQCRWKEEKSQTLSSSLGSNGNIYAQSGINASNENPSSTTNGLKVSALGPDYNVRVQVCVSSTLFGLGNEKCKVYPTTNGTYPSGVLKPVGLLQTYGDSGQLLFGLFTGSYGASQSGGALRRNIGSMTSEINVTGDGTFKAPLSTGGILQSLNALRIYGYNFGDGTYFGVTGSDNCSWGLSSFSNGNCSNWGNPQSEMYLESLRYLMGQSATSAFNVDDSARFTNLKTAAWSAPISANNYCAPLSVLQFNASTSSYDGDELSGASNLGVGTGTSSTLSDLTDLIGNGEGITGNSYFIGQIAGATAPNNNQLCTAKTVNNLSKAQGTCPDAPRLQGSYQIGGLAYFAHTNGIVGAPGLPSQKVRTYGVALAPATPKIVVPVPGSTTGKTISILPACRNSTVGGNCAIVDFKIVSQTSTTLTNSGKLYVNWEDSEQGGDYDQDMWGIISYQVTSTGVQITTQAVAKSTGDLMGFGYVIGGTTADGFYAHSGINGFTNTAPTVVPSGATLLRCNNCNVGDAATTSTYPIGTSSAKSLQQPLYYAAKWGGFDDSNSNNKPDLPSEWDSNGDGIPDTYFYATNPAQLESSLSAALLKVSMDVGSSAAVATSTTNLNTSAVIYQAKFNSQGWTGQLLAYSIQIDGSISPSPLWDASTAGKIPTSGRKVFTWNGSAGTTLTWTNLTSAQQAALTASGESNSTNAQYRLSWLLGDQSQEQPIGALRKRTTLLGDIVDSAPVYSGGDDFGYKSLPSSKPGQSSYATYVAAKKMRTPIILVGANDGMLHAFDASTGSSAGNELFAYMPSPALMKAISLSNPNYGSIAYPHQYFVDGKLYVDDIYYSGQWHTVLLGSLGAGGQGIFALDISDPTNFNASNVLFELTPADDARLGNVMGQPSIALLPDGSWSAVFGNGVNNSQDGKAYLFVVDMTNKSNRTVIPAGSGINNGLSGPALLLNADNTISTAYAGDLLGNLWKFDLSSANRSDWAVAYGAPLFTARGPSNEVQPITSTPNLGLNSMKGNDVMVYFGTGQYFAVGDNLVTGSGPVQSFYAIDDNGSAITSTNRSLLQQKTITSQDATKRTVPEPTFNWAGVRGWYLDLIYNNTKTGERVISSPLLIYDRLIFLTFIPSQQACSYGGSGWLMDIGAVSPTSKPILTNSGQPLAFGSVDGVTPVFSGSNFYGLVSPVNGTPPTAYKGSLQANNPMKGKLSWWQLQ